MKLHKLSEFNRSHWIAALAIVILSGVLAGCTTATNDPTFALLKSTPATATPTLMVLPPVATSLPPVALATGTQPTPSPVIGPAITSTAFVPPPGDPPPLALVLPSGWRATYTQAPILAQGQQVLINVAGYAGPVADHGTGFLYILWNYPSLVPVNPAAVPTTTSDINQAEIYSDGLRFLQGTILDSDCTIGNYGHQTFKVGGQSAVGQMFQSSQCPDGSPDVAGWYSGINLSGQKLLFYAYIQPVSAYNNGHIDLQHILDSVTFHVPTPIGGSSGPTLAPVQLGVTVPATLPPALQATGTPMLS
jgi:hypothetical protein